MNDPKCYYRQKLNQTRDEVNHYGLDQFFTTKWFESVEKSIEEWDGQADFSLDKNTFFISYIQGDDRSILREIRAILDVLQQTPKAAIVRQRIKSLAGDTANAVGGLFELLAIYPLILSPNELIEFEPKIGITERKAEVLVKIAGDELYIEAAIFTKKDPAFEHPEGSWFDPVEQQQSEGATLRGKILEKGEQYCAADKPALLFIAEGMVTTGLTLGRDPREWAMSHLNSGGSGIAAVAFAKNCFCESVDLRLNPNAMHPLPQQAIEFIEAKAQSWLVSQR